MTVLIAVWGAAPGIGKSTVCASLAGWLTGTGLKVDHFAEEEILTRPQFAEVAEYFRTTGNVDPVSLLEAAARLAKSVVDDHIDVVIADALVPFVPSLLAAGLSDEKVSRFVAELTAAMEPVEPVLLFLDGDPAAALRAAARKGPRWLDWYMRKLASYGLTADRDSLASALTYLERERHVTLTTTRLAGWGVIAVEGATELPPDEIACRARHRVSEALTTQYT